MIIIILLCPIFLVSATASVWDTLTANIAVVEYLPIEDSTSSVQEKVLKNAAEYTKEIQTLSTNTTLDLVIFPEATLSDTPETSSEVEIGTTCDDSSTCSDLLKQISKTARTYKTYIVINMVEKSKCDDSENQSENCKNLGFYYYNTNVIFDRNGTIIQKYQKYNLFGEYDKDQPLNPDQVTVDTDFGVKFGTFTCFDLLFKSPAQDLLAQNIDGIIFPSMWFSELPFLTAVQAQQMFAYTHNVTFFSAGANNPSEGSGGTAIFKGKGEAFLREIVASGGTRSFLYQSINGVVSSFENVDGVVSPAETKNTDVLAKEMDNFYLKIDDSLLDLNSTLLDTTNPDFSGQICYNGDLPTNKLCCNFDIKMSKTTPRQNSKFYTYHLVAFSGIRTFTGVYNGGIELCGLIACLNSSLPSCGQRFPNYDDVEWPITFEQIKITADFEKSENKTQYPNSVLSSILSIDPTKTSWTSEEKEDVITKIFSTKESQNRILTFGIYGRNFGQDSPPGKNKNDGDETGSGNGVEIVSKILLSCLVFLFLIK